MQPGNVSYVVVTVKNTTTGAAVTGLVTAGFTVDYYLSGTTPVSVFSVSEISAGRYRVLLTMPSTVGYLSVFVTAAGYTVENGRWHVELEDQDLDSIYGVVVRPLSQLAGASELASEVTLSMNARRYKELTVSVVDGAGTAINLSGYTNWRFSVWDRAHTGAVYSLTTGIAGSAAGIVTWSVPEDAAFNSFMDTAILAGDSSVTLFYDMIADKAATITKTEAIFRGQLILYRWEGSAA